MRVGIIQSNYIPWMGYFEFISKCDLFILLDDVQFTRRDWRNRNKIRTKEGDRWLTIPLKQSGNYEARINEMMISDPMWVKHHFDILSGNYQTAVGWKRYAEELEWCYIDSPDDLSNINRNFLELGMKWLGIQTPIKWSTEYPSEGTKSEKILTLCQACGATSYLSGPTAKSYLEEGLLAQAGIGTEWMTYHDWPKLSFLHVLLTSGKDPLSILPR